MDDHRVGKKRTVMATFVKPKRNSGVASIKGASKKAENGDMYQKNSACDHAAAMEDIASSTLTYLDKIDSEKSRPYLTLCPVQTFRPIHQLESTRLFLTQTLGDPNLEASASGSGW
ncbi:hypothetical protein BU17DRAFT_72701 [Hysterangium stoloniferum]|nr:hypothetical protein BU17DRAFT_72701 [Hysterangium stoloniferum]